MKKQSFSASLYIIICALCVFSVLALAIVGLAYYDFNHTAEDSLKKPVSLFNGDYRIRNLTSAETLWREGSLLIDISVLSQHCSYGVAGDKTSRTIVFSNGGYADFSTGGVFCLNGEYCFLDSNCHISDGRFYVPLSFFENYISGLKIFENKSGTRLIIDVSSQKYSLISYSSKPEQALSLDDYFEVTASFGNQQFKTNLDEYEKYIDPVDRDKYLILINSTSPLEKDYIPQNLTNLIHTRKDGRAAQQLELYAAKAMEAMLNEAAANGFTTLSITSGYRSYNYQQQLFNNQVAALVPSFGENAREKAAEAVALPGTSEHQSGLCADLHNLSSASQRFAETPEYRWLIENCAKFGFILRYPKNKTHITGIMFEPWHYRYVGRYHARRIMQDGLCLEEYLQLLSEAQS